MRIDNKTIVDSITNALQHISYYQGGDFLSAMIYAYENEESVLAKNAIENILHNSQLCLFNKRPICQDTGMIVVFAQVGIEVSFEGNKCLDTLVNEGVRSAYLSKENTMRSSMVENPIFDRKNTQDNTPAILHTTIVLGNKIKFSVIAKGGGSENKSITAMLNPNDNIEEWVVDKVSKMGSGWCPPGVIGIGVGGSLEKAVILAKESLLEPINMQELLIQKNRTNTEEMRVDLYKDINNLGIGAQGLGGKFTVLDVKIKDFPTHAASLPVALVPNCAANRHVEFSITSNKTFDFDVPKSEYEKLSKVLKNSTSKIKKIKKINLDTIDSSDLLKLKAGENILISGEIITARDAAHKKFYDALSKGESLPVNLDNKFIYYVGPVPAIDGEVVGPAGPTTAKRMDKYMDIMLEKTGIMGTIGKAERSEEVVKLMKKHKKLYFVAVGGAAYVISQSIKKSEVIAYPELGMEAVHKMVIEDMPVTVAIDCMGNCIHNEGPKEWKKLNIVKSKLKN